MNCRDAGELVHAYADDELDVVAARQVDQHLKECGRCRRTLESVQAVKTAASNPALYYKAPTGLRARVLAATGASSADSHLHPVANPLPLAATRNEVGRSRTPRIWWGLALAAGVLLALGLVSLLRVQRESPVMVAVLTAHLRSLQPSHLMDVVSTDQHTVKPWFDTHVDFSPPVRQLAPDFPLVGGRLDYFEDRTVAALIYKRGQHIINVFIWPGESGQGAFERRGFNLVHWSANGMTFWAISDLNPQELDHFTQVFRTASIPAISPK